jgi:hypothetical protein
MIIHFDQADVEAAAPCIAMIAPIILSATTTQPPGYLVKNLLKGGIALPYSGSTPVTAPCSDMAGGCSRKPHLHMALYNHLLSCKLQIWATFPSSRPPMQASKCMYGGATPEAEPLSLLHGWFLQVMNCIALSTAPCMSDASQDWALEWA